MIRMVVRRAVSVAVALVALAAPRAGAQEPQIARRWELVGPPFDFRPDGVWRPRARAVAQARAAALARGDFQALNAAAPGVSGPSAMAVTGVLTTPAVLLKFADTPAQVVLGDSAAYRTLLFGATPPAGRPYTLRTYFEQLSSQRFSVQGAAIGWVTLAGNEATYTGPATGCTPYGTCNGVWSGAAVAAMQAGLREAIAAADAQGVDWSRFGYDPATGVLDLVTFFQVNRDGACRIAGNNHIWGHRSWLGSVATATPWPSHPGQYLRVADYIIQSAAGGATGCDTTQMAAIGTAAHETGHGIGLPDLYDTNPNDADDSEGIGEWGLMGSGNWARPFSPAFFEAWTRQQVGWVTVRPLTAAASYTVGPVATGDTVLLVRPNGSNPRGEYFLIENRQALKADSATIGKGKAPGLLVWHIDSLKIASGGAINSGALHGVVLTEADGFNNLLSSSSTSGGSAPGVYNRGDAGDPFPGLWGRTALGPSATFPRNNLNDAGQDPGFQLDSIRQLTPGGAMAFWLQLAVAESVVVALTPRDTTVTAGDTVRLRLTMDASGLSSQQGVGSGALVVRWNPARLGYVSSSPVDVSDVVVNAADSALGVLRLAFARATALPTVTRLLSLAWRPLLPAVGDTTGVTVTVSELSAAGSFASLTGVAVAHGSLVHRGVARDLTARLVSPSSSATRGLTFETALTFDGRGRGVTFASYSAQVLWDTTHVRLDSVRAGTAAHLRSPVVNLADTSLGRAQLAAADAYGDSGLVSVARLFWRPKTAAPDTITLGLRLTELSAATTFENLLPRVDVRDLRLPVASFRHGDVDNDGLVNSRDALFVLSHAVGLPLPPYVVIAQGDADCDGLVNPRDALLILSYDVGLPTDSYCVGRVPPMVSRTTSSSRVT